MVTMGTSVESSVVSIALMAGVILQEIVYLVAKYIGQVRNVTSRFVTLTIVNNVDCQKPITFQYVLDVLKECFIVTNTTIV